MSDRRGVSLVTLIADHPVEIRYKCRQVGGGQQNPNIFWMSYKDAPKRRAFRSFLTCCGAVRLKIWSGARIVNTRDRHKIQSAEQKPWESRRRTTAPILPSINPRTTSMNAAPDFYFFYIQNSTEDNITFWLRRRLTENLERRSDR